VAHTKYLLFITPIIQLITVLHHLEHLPDLDFGFDRRLRVLKHLNLTADQIFTGPMVQSLVTEAAVH
jgi:hypothetical protein